LLVTEPVWLTEEEKQMKIKIRRRVLFAVATILIGVLSGTGQAVELSTPPIGPLQGLGDNIYACQIANMSDVNQTVRIQFFNVNGVLLSDTGDVPLSPLDVVGDTAGASQFPAYCKLIATGKKKDYSATMQVYKSDVGPLVAIRAE